MSGYPSDLNDAQWARIAAFFPAQTGPGRRRTVDLRRVVDALLYRLRTGCQWRWLPRDLPAWRSVYYYFGKWTRAGTLERIHDRLRAEDRARAGRDPEPTAAIIDSQSAKSTPVTAETGYDAGEKNQGAQAASARGHGRPVAHRARPRGQCARGRRGRGRTRAGARSVPDHPQGVGRQRVPHRAPDHLAGGALARSRPGDRVPARGHKGLRRPAPPLGRRAHLRLAHRQPAPEQGV